MTAFSYVDLREEIYIEKLNEFEEGNIRVGKRKKSVHVLK